MHLDGQRHAGSQTLFATSEINDWFCSLSASLEWGWKFLSWQPPISRMPCSVSVRKPVSLNLKLITQEWGSAPISHVNKYRRSHYPCIDLDSYHSRFLYPSRPEAIFLNYRKNRHCGPVYIYTRSTVTQGKLFGQNAVVHSVVDPDP